MLRKLKFISLLLAFTLLFGNVSAYAAQGDETPDNSSNVITVQFGQDSSNPDNYNQISFSSDRISGKADIDGVLYDTDKTTARRLMTLSMIEELSTGWFTDGNELYKMTAAGSPEKNTTGYSLSYTLSKTDEKPASSFTQTIRHENAGVTYEEKFFVNGKEVTYSEYKAAKNGDVEDEKTSDSYVKDLEAELVSSTTTYTGYEEKDSSITWSDGVDEAIKTAQYNFTVDEYYDVNQLWLKKYELTTKGTSSDPDDPDPNDPVDPGKPEDPIDPNNPVLEVKYDGAEFSSMSFSFEQGNVTGKADIDGVLYDTSKTYDLHYKTTPETGWYIHGTDLYKLHFLKVTEPTGTAGYVYSFELVPTEEMPSSSAVTRYKHQNYDDEVIHKYFVNGKECTKTYYEGKKTGAYDEMTKTGLPEVISSELDHSVATFEGISTRDTTRTWSDGYVENITVASYKYKVDEYTNVKRKITVTHELTVSGASSGQNSGSVVPSVSDDPQAGSSASETPAVKPTLKVKVKISKPKPAKTSITVKWKKASKKNRKKISGYQIQISTKKSFKAAKTYKAGKKASSKKISKLKRKTTYYVRMRTYKGKKVGKWSAVKKVKTK